MDRAVATLIWAGVAAIVFVAVNWTASLLGVPARLDWQHWLFAVVGFSDGFGSALKGGRA